MAEIISSFESIYPPYAYPQKREMVIKMNKTEVHDKNAEHVSRRHILLLVVGFLLLGAILELILGLDKSNGAIPIIVVAIAIIYIYIKKI